MVARTGALRCQQSIQTLERKSMRHPTACRRFRPSLPRKFSSISLCYPTTARYRPLQSDYPPSQYHSLTPFPYRYHIYSSVPIEHRLYSPHTRPRDSADNCQHSPRSVLALKVLAPQATGTLARGLGALGELGVELDDGLGARRGSARGLFVSVSS